MYFLGSIEMYHMCERTQCDLTRSGCGRARPYRVVNGWCYRLAGQPKRETLNQRKVHVRHGCSCEDVRGGMRGPRGRQVYIEPVGYGPQLRLLEVFYA